jgi:hypothetical protein
MQLITIKIIPSRLHVVYELQQSLNECCRIHRVDYYKVICKYKKYRRYKNCIFKVPPYKSTFTLKFKQLAHVSKFDRD